jgi:hypothetical protein
MSNRFDSIFSREECSDSQCCNTEIDTIYRSHYSLDDQTVQHRVGPMIPAAGGIAPANGTASRTDFRAAWQSKSMKPWSTRKKADAIEITDSARRHPGYRPAPRKAC